MTVAALRPYFAPHAGYFRVVAEADLLVVLDLVQFPRGTTWITRNRFKNADGELWLTVPVWKKGLGLQRIADVKICDEGKWRHKHVQSLKAAYAHAPFFLDHLPFLEDLYDGPHDHIASFNTALIAYIVGRLGLTVQMILQSEMGIEGTGSSLLADLIRHVGADEIVVPGGAEKHLDDTVLRHAGARLRLIQTRPPTYPQLWGPFLPDLSVLDILFTCGSRARRILRIDSGVCAGGSDATNHAEGVSHDRPH
ncbi:WbqC family protein [Candidatus Fermentibacteria bacterium]|nr:WbqC family protein [Candidatus Fermentibacteria bacterium]